MIYLASEDDPFLSSFESFLREDLPDFSLRLASFEAGLRTLILFPFLTGWGCGTRILMAFFRWVWSRCGMMNLMIVDPAVFDLSLVNDTDWSKRLLGLDRWRHDVVRSARGLLYSPLSPNQALTRTRT